MTPEITLEVIEWLEDRARQVSPVDAEKYRKAADEMRWRLPDDHQEHPKNKK